jgi:hypothetical protein
VDIYPVHKTFPHNYSMSESANSSQEKSLKWTRILTTSPLFNHLDQHSTTSLHNDPVNSRALSTKIFNTAAKTKLTQAHPFLMKSRQSIDNPNDTKEQKKSFSIFNHALAPSAPLLTCIIKTASRDGTL